MRNKLLVSVALLAAATTVGSCEKAPDREPAAGRSGSATSSSTSEDQQHQPGGRRLVQVGGPALSSGLEEARALAGSLIGPW